MFFITGWGSKRKAIAEGRFQCPVCSSEEAFTRFSERNWFSVFFIPIFPLTAPTDYVQCWKCGTVLEPERVGLAQQFSPLCTVSAAAVTAFVFSILSLLTICIFILAIPLALVSIVLGHIGLSIVRNGEPRISGRWQAITALCISYPVLLLSIGIAVWVFIPRSGSQYMAGDGGAFSSDVNEALASDDPVERLREAEFAVAVKGDQAVGRGNSPEARLVAGLFANRLKDLREVAFTEGKNKLFSASQGEFITYCELHSDRCLFVVHVPSYRDYKSEAKELLANIAWGVAQNTVRGRLKPGDSLAVALRGTLLYGDILKGVVSGEDEDEDIFVLVDKDELYSFFPSRKAPLIAANQSNAREAGAAVVNGKEAGSLNEAVAERADESSEREMREDPFMAKNEKPFAEDAGRNDRGEATASSVTETSPKGIVSKPPEVKPPMVKKEPEEPSFVNRLAMEKLLTIDNKMWAFQSLAFSEDGKWLAAGKMDNVIVLFDAMTGGVLGQVEDLRELGQVTQVAINADKSRLVAGGYSGETKAFEISSAGKIGGAVDLYRHGKEVTNLQVSKKYGFVISGGRDGTIAWQPVDKANNQVRLLQELKDNVMAIGLPDTGSDAWATDGSAVVKFSLKDSSISEKLDRKNQYWQAAAFSADGNKLVLGGYSEMNLVNLWRPTTERVVKLNAEEAIHGLVFHPNGKWFIAGVRGKVVIWDFEAGEKIAEHKCDTIQYIKTLALSTDGSLLAVTANSAQEDIVVFRLGKELQP